MRIHFAAMGSVALLTLAADRLLAAPRLAEFLTDPVQGETLEDEDGEAVDWIEVVNAGVEAVGLGGYGLSDDPSIPLKWVFPARVLAAGERVVVFASGKNRRPATGELHANFALQQAGEPLVLASPAGVVIDGFLNGYPPQRVGVSYGRARPLAENRLIGLGSPCRYRVPTGSLAGWQSRTYVDGGWAAGSLAVGYDIDGDYASIIGAGSDTGAAMYEIRPTAYVRVPFTIQDPSKVRAVELRMKYDDGFDAFINGVKVASRYMVDEAQWNSFATDNRIDALNDRYETIDIEAAIGALVPGQNVLAIQGCNFTSNGLDFLIDPEVWAYVDEGGAEFDAYFEVPTPGQPNNRSVLGFVQDTKFSVNRGFYSTPFDLSITSATPGATIRYTLDGQPPTAASGEVFTGPIRVGSSVTVRAAAFKEGHRETDVDAHTYLFTADIRTQPEMLSTVVNAPAYSAQIEPGLRSLPVVALSLRDSDFFADNGIYSIATLSGRAQEVEVSFEFFDPADGRMVQAAGGIRIHGGNARSHPKKPLRLYFRGVYGDKRLEYPLFDEAPVSRFDQLVLRPGGHDSWSLASTFGATSTDLPPHATFMRDQFLRRTEIDLGLLSPYGRYVNLFINGRYWGLYDLHERPNAAYFADHEGGREEDYDVVHHPELLGETHTVVDGSGDSWEALISRAQGAQSVQAYADIGGMLAIDDFIDHLIVRLWSGDYDWCGPIYRGAQNVTVFGSKNWYAGRRARGDQPDGFRLFSWDAEMSMGTHLMQNLNGEPVAQRVTNFDLTRANDSGSPAGLYDALKRNAVFRVRFGDRLQKHFFNNGAMTVAAIGARWTAMESEIQGAIIGESARWGHETATVLTRDGHWRPEVSWVKNTFIPGRNATVLAQFRTAGLFPTTTAPTFSQLGGPIPGDGSFRLTMTAPAGATIYYTLDGSDPYVAPAADLQPLVGEEALVSVLVPTVANGGSDLGATWRGVAEPANAGEWREGTNGVGFETVPEDYAALIRTDVGEMYGSHGSVLIRIPFEIVDAESLASFEKLSLNMRYDDGFAAYLNGEPVAAANAPVNPAYDSLATANHADSAAVVLENFDITIKLGALQIGSNVLAIQGLNDGLASSDLLIQAELEAGRDFPGGPTAGALIYASPVAMSQSGIVKARTRSASGEWSPLTEARFTIGLPASEQNLVVSEIAYRPLGPATVAEIASGATDRGAFEFLEITNIAANRVDLAGVRFTAGIEFDFSGSAVTSLGPGQRAVVVANRAAFIARYGLAASAAVAGEFAGQKDLNNGGEILELTAADGSNIQRFFYDDEAPWPEAADGDGPTLELIEPDSRSNPGDARNWRASLDPGGTPGGLELADYTRWARRYFDPAAPDFAQRSAPAADPDGDGLVNAWEQLFAFHPAVANGHGVHVSLVQDAGDTFLSIEAALRPGVVNRVRAESSSDMTAWSSIDVVVAEDPVSLADGRQRVRFRTTDAVGVVPRFLRLAAVP
ncbi:MAG: chitobiase/beta-hexosaminidase C-terminal domain-containing protein [Verrucomicrobiales bacterium]